MCDQRRYLNESGFLLNDLGSLLVQLFPGDGSFPPAKAQFAGSAWNT
jgi:hypothetical protein